jgi:phage gp37-like protein
VSLGTLARAEDALLARIDAELSGELRASASLPGEWTDELLREALARTPGVYVSFAGGEVEPEADQVVLMAHFEVHALTGQPHELDRRRGNAELGAYEILERIARVLHGCTIEGVGSVTLLRIAPAFRDQLFDVGGTAYVATFALPLPLEAPLPETGLGDFLHFHADLDAPLGEPAWRPARAALTVTSGTITAVTVSDAGAGYTQAPEIRLYGPGSGALLSVEIADGAVSAITVLDGGAGYSRDFSALALAWPPGGRIDAEDDVVLPAPAP